MTGPDISVVVPVRDGAATLPALLDSLAAQTLEPRRFEVVVADNASRDATARVARERGVTVVSEPQRGRARARNAGAAAARGERLAFVDADCVADRCWLAALLGCLERAPLAAGPIELRTSTPPTRIERFELISRYDQEHAVLAGGWAASANLGIRREAFDALGGFDPAYRQIGEDVDLCLRGGRAGLSIGWCPGAVVRTRAERRLRAVLARAARHGHAGTQHHRRLGPGSGRRYWRHPGPLVRGDWALRRFQRDVQALPPPDRRDLMTVARAEYAARVAGSLWAEITRAR